MCQNILVVAREELHRKKFQNFFISMILIILSIKTRAKVQYFSGITKKYKKNISVRPSFTRFTSLQRQERQKRGGKEQQKGAQSVKKGLPPRICARIKRKKRTFAHSL
jgi:hypothetical protein